MCLLACAPLGCSSDGESSTPAVTSVGGGPGFFTNIALCPLADGIRSAILAGTLLVPVDLPAFVTALQDADFSGVQHSLEASADAKRPGWMTATSRDFAVGVDARGDGVVVLGSGEVYVVSGCPLDGLGQVHRLDLALAAAWTLLVELQPPSDVPAAVRGWTRPAAWYGDSSVTYLRQYLADGLDLNGAQSGGLALSVAPKGAGFGIYGAANAGGAGDVVGIEVLRLGDAEVASHDKRVVKGPGALVWDVGEFVGAGETAVELDLLIADTSVRWKIGVWDAFFEAFFGGDDGKATEPAVTPPVLAVQLLGALPGRAQGSRLLGALELPDAVTALLAG